MGPGARGDGARRRSAGPGPARPRILLLFGPLLVGAASIAGPGSLAATGPSAQAEDGRWAQWRGPERDGSLAVALPAGWSRSLQRRWRTEVGGGHASPIVAGDRVWQFSRLGEREGLTALELATGEVLWRVDHEVPFTMNRGASPHGKGPKSTPALADGRVFTLGIAGALTAHDAGDGRVLWRHEFRDDFAATHPKFGAGMSPVVVGDRIVAHVGTEGDGALAAFDVASGERVWSMEEDGPAFASPVLVRIDGVRQLVTQTRSRVLSVDPHDGSTLWSIPFTTRFDQNIVTPLAVGERLILSGLDHGVFAVRPRRGPDGWEVRELWRNREVSMYMSSPVLAAGRIFGMSHRRAGQFFALDPEDGALLWTSRGRDADHAGLLASGDQVVLLTDAAELIVLDAGAESYAPRARIEVAPTPTWAHPVPAGSGLLIKDKEHLSLWEPSR